MPSLFSAQETILEELNGVVPSCGSGVCGAFLERLRGATASAGNHLGIAWGECSATELPGAFTASPKDSSEEVIPLRLPVRRERPVGTVQMCYVPRRGFAPAHQDAKESETRCRSKCGTEVPDFTTEVRKELRSVESRYPCPRSAPVPTRHHHGSSEAFHSAGQERRTPLIGRGEHDGSAKVRRQE